MVSPFEKLLNKALSKSSAEENLLLKEARKIIDRGYPETEIIEILERYKKSLIDAHEIQIVSDTLEELIEDEDEW